MIKVGTKLNLLKFKLIFFNFLLIGAPLLISLDNRMYQVGVFLKNIPITIDYRENICGPGLINIFAAINKPVLDWIQSITQNAACFADLNMKIQ